MPMLDRARERASREETGAEATARARAEGKSEEEAQALGSAAVADRNAKDTGGFLGSAARGLWGGAGGKDAGAGDGFREQGANAAAGSAWDRLGESIPSEESQQWHSGSETEIGAAAAGGAAADAGSVEAQRRAMSQLGDVYGGYNDIYSQGGLTDADRSRIQQSQMEQKRFERGQQEAQMQQAAARGMLGGGGELLGRFGAQQEGANRANEQGLGIEAMAQQRAMDALGGMGQASSALGGVSGQARGQSFEEQFRTRQAQDQRDEFNSGLRGRNVDRGNEDQRHNAGLGQQAFDNRTTVTSGREGVYGREADALARTAREKRDRQAEEEARAAGRISGVITAVGSGGSSLATDAARRATEDDED